MTTKGIPEQWDSNTPMTLSKAVGSNLHRGLFKNARSGAANPHKGSDSETPVLHNPRRHPSATLLSGDKGRIALAMRCSALPVPVRSRNKARYCVTMPRTILVLQN